MHKLHDSITDKRGTYIISDDYKYFYCNKTVSNGKSKIKKLFLTYNGILKVLFSSKNNKTKPFTSWATKTLFVAHLGTQQSKNQLASSLLGIDLASVNKFLTASPSPLSVIYFIFIGHVKNLKNKYNLGDNLDDELMMCRYGFTEDLNRRTKEHKKKFGNQIELLLFNIIDPTYLSKAETSLDRYFESTSAFIDLEIDGNNEKEVVAITKLELKNVKKQFELIGSKYEGKMNKQSEFIKDLINKHQKEIMIEKHQKEIMIEKHQKEIMIEKYQKELLKKDNEILKQQLEIVQLKAKNQ